MASPTFVSASTSTIQESTATLSVSHTVSAGSNRKLLVLVETEYTDTSLAVTSAQYNGQNLSAIGSVLVGATFSNTVYAFYLDDANFPTPGTYTLFAYLNVVGAGIIHVIELADAAQGIRGARLGLDGIGRRAAGEERAEHVGGIGGAFGIIERRCRLLVG